MELREGAAAVHLFLRGILRFSTTDYPEALGACYVASWQLPRPESHQLRCFASVEWWLNYGFQDYHNLKGPMIRITLTKERKKTALRLQARQEVGRVSERIHFVLLSHQGYSPPAIAELYGYTADTVRTWLKRYQTDDVGGLYDRPRSGCPQQEPDLKAIVEAQLGQSPGCFGYVAACWTIRSLVGHLASRFRVQTSVATVRRTARALGYRWRRPRLAPTRRVDPDQNAKLTSLLAWLQHKTAEIHLLFADESDLHLLPVLRAMWMRGQQRRVPTPGNNK